ncbi:gustatory receptor 8a-like [Bactrocera neohumeralis]|uniref:gustatory receptor 8a-like n=1 Tax=Bactrocera neohumeralis TaxID=98809 RepID=UPI002166B494|nr:gustatory receptor 8a-like [Bactrocera neohumeralis]
MHKQVPFVVRFHTRLFQIIGCCDVSWQTQPREKRLAEQRLVAWTVLVLLIYSFVFINTFVHPSAFLFTSESFGYFVDALKVCLAYVTVAIIYTETVLRRHALQHFWQRYALLNPASNQQVEPMKIDWRSQLRAYHRFLYVFYGITVFDLILEIIYYVTRAKDDHMLQFLLMFTPYTYMIHLRNMQIIFHIVIINHELVKLRHDIGLLAEYTRFTRNTMPFVGFEDFVRQKLAEKQLIYQRIYEMCDYFQQALGASTIAVLLMTYVRLVVDAYFSLYSFHTKTQPKYIENLLLLPAYLEIPALLLTSQKCMNEVKFIAFELHNIRSSVDNSLISIQIQNFSLQILHQKIRIDGLGISALDGKMLVSIVGSITTYMVFFIQFMPKFKNL